jgi:branched-chain amino acid transport system substrate-binding protein
MGLKDERDETRARADEATWNIAKEVRKHLNEKQREYLDKKFGEDPPEKSRREYLKTAAALAAGFVAGGVVGGAVGWFSKPAEVIEKPPEAVKLPDPIKIGNIAIRSGPWGSYGQFMEMGARLAAEEINATGGILGSKVELDFRDDELSIDTGVKQARYLVEEWGAHCINGVDSSPVAGAIAEIMPELGRNFIITHACIHTITEDTVYRKGYKNTFRIVVPCPYQDSVLLAYMVATWPIKRWAGIHCDEEYGYECWAWFQYYLKKLRPDVEFVENTYSKYGTTDFSPHISKVMAAEPEAIHTTLWAGEAVMCCKQAMTWGAFKTLKAWCNCMGAAIDVLEGYGKGGFPQDKLWCSSRGWPFWPNSPQQQDFVKRFKARWGHYPPYSAASTYDAVYAYKAAVEMAKSVDVDKTTEALENMAFPKPSGLGFGGFRKEDHQYLYAVPWGRVYDDPNYEIPVLKDLFVLPAEMYYRYPPFEPAKITP